MTPTFLALLQEAAPEAEPGFLSTLRWIDYVGLALVSIFLVLGVVRGLWWQVIRLVGLVAAVAAARFLAPQAEPWLADTFPGLTQRVAFGISWVAVFLATLMLATLLALLGRRALAALQLSSMDRIAGGFAGALTGLVVFVVLLGGMVHLTPKDWARETLAETYSRDLMITFTRWPVVVSHASSSQIEEVLGIDIEEQPAGTEVR
jgi:membrane protein required for colicin V production